jgi:MFS transporter, MHS family, citrate/tricarballylate:H+ symporter
VVGSVVRVSIGNYLEMYDFMVFGYYAADIGRTFFPSSNPFASLLLSLTTFGAGFLMRPLGAIVLGNYIDRQGRRRGLILTLGLMAAGTLSVACAPGYATIGIAAPFLVLAGRLIQGFSAGAEVGAASVYLAEIATPGHKGFYTSWQSASQQLAVMFAALLGLLVAPRWGWRAPLLIGCALIPFLFWVRSSLVETEAFLARKHHPSVREIWTTILAHGQLIVLGMMLSALTTVSFYMITAYTPTFGSSILHLAGRQNLLVTFCIGASNFVLVPVMGALSDKVGRRPQLAASATAALLTAAPLYIWLVAAPSAAKLLFVELWFSLIFASCSGAMVPFLTEIMPASVRTTGYSLAFSLATAIFGGFTPAISTALIGTTGSRAMPALWLSFAAILALIAVALLKSVPEEGGRPVNPVYELAEGQRYKQG